MIRQLLEHPCTGVVLPGIDTWATLSIHYDGSESLNRLLGMNHEQLPQA